MIFNRELMDYEYCGTVSKDQFLSNLKLVTGNHLLNKEPLRGKVDSEGFTVSLTNKGNSRQFPAELFAQVSEYNGNVSIKGIFRITLFTGIFIRIWFIGVWILLPFGFLIGKITQGLQVTGFELGGVLVMTLTGGGLLTVGGLLVVQIGVLTAKKQCVKIEALLKECDSNNLVARLDEEDVRDKKLLKDENFFIVALIITTILIGFMFWFMKVYK